MSEKEVRKVLEKEQLWLWCDLLDDLRRAANGWWSIAAESRIMRIIWIANVVGVTEDRAIQLPLLSSGIYNAVRRKMGLEEVVLDLTGYEEHSVYPPEWSETVKRIADMELEEM